MTAAHGGQVVVSGATEMLARDQLPDGLELVDLGEHRLRDLGQPMQVFQLSPRAAHPRSSRRCGAWTRSRETCRRRQVRSSGAKRKCRG